MQRNPNVEKHNRLQKMIVAATVAIVALGFGACRSDAARIVVRIRPRPRVMKRVVIVRPAPHRVWRAGHWEYRPARHCRVWVTGRWVWVR